MGLTTTEDALATALDATVSRLTVADVLARLMQDCLEVLQIQHASGSCVDAVRTNEVLHVRGRAELAERWGEVGAAIADAGYDEVQAYPMHGQGAAIGGLSRETALARVREAVAARAVVEQAKGVLAFELGTDPGSTYDVLVQRARESGLGLTATAVQVLSRAYEQ